MNPPPIHLVSSFLTGPGAMKWLLRGFAAIAVAIVAATVAGPARRLARIATVTVPNKEKDGGNDFSDHYC